PLITPTTSILYPLSLHDALPIFINDHLIYESGPGESSGGRRPVMLLFNEEAGYSIGIDVGVNYLLGVLTDLNGNIHQEKIITFNHLSYEEIEEKLFEVIDFLKNTT